MKVKGFLGALVITSLALLTACGGGSNSNSNANNYNVGNINTRNATNTVSNAAGNVANATSNVASTIGNKISNAVGNNSAPSANTTSTASGAVRGNKSSHLYHLSNCPDYDKIAKANIVTFASRTEAEKAGYRIAKNCPGEEGARNTNKAATKNSNQSPAMNKNNANMKRTQAKP